MEASTIAVSLAKGVPYTVKGWPPLNALALAAQKGLRSIAFPLIGAGVGGGAEERVLAWMRDEMARASFDGEVRIVRFRS